MEVPVRAFESPPSRVRVPIVALISPASRHPPSSHSSPPSLSATTRLMLLRYGDIEPNPGPRTRSQSSSGDDGTPSIGSTDEIADFVEGDGVPCRDLGPTKVADKSVSCRL